MKKHRKFQRNFHFQKTNNELWTPDLEIGHKHSVIWISIDTDDIEPFKPEEHYGAIIRHKPGPYHKNAIREYNGLAMCEVRIIFNTPQSKEWLKRNNEYYHPLWTVNSWDPFDISPSVVCKCGDHGFIKKGQWIVC